MLKVRQFGVRGGFIIGVGFRRPLLRYIYIHTHTHIYIYKAPRKGYTLKNHTEKGYKQKMV